MTDDTGYADIRSFGARDIRTPNIDSLGRDGVKLTDFQGLLRVGPSSRACSSISKRNHCRKVKGLRSGKRANYAEITRIANCSKNG
jgi:hypothetical protein